MRERCRRHEGNKNERKIVATIDDRRVDSVAVNRCCTVNYSSPPLLSLLPPITITILPVVQLCKHTRYTFYDCVAQKLHVNVCMHVYGYERVCARFKYVTYLSVCVCV